MRRFKRREILRIGARDIFQYVPLASLTEDLSAMTDSWDGILTLWVDAMDGEFADQRGYERTIP